LKAEVGQDAFDAPRAEGPARLAELLGDDGGGRLRVEEAMADDLAHGFVGAAVGAFGAALLAGEGAGPAAEEVLAELEVALFAETELGGGLRGAESQALALNEHGELVGDLIIGGHGEGAGRADELLKLQVEVEHRWTSGAGKRSKATTVKVGAGGAGV
jgi:hypothetical protein